MSAPKARSTFARTLLWEICAVVPENHVNRVTLAIQEASEPNIPASEVFPESTPGSRLRGARWLMGLPQAQLAAKIGVGVPNISAMEHGRRPIGKAMAKKIGEVLASKTKRPGGEPGLFQGKLLG